MSKIQVTEQMGERYAQAKTNISWAQPALFGKVDLTALRTTMNELHRAWPGSIYADENFPALLDRFDAEWSEVMRQCQV